MARFVRYCGASKCRRSGNSGRAEESQIPTFLTHFRSGVCIAAIEDDCLISYSINSLANDIGGPSFQPGSTFAIVSHGGG
jgi:hypothetical protein